MASSTKKWPKTGAVDRSANNTSIEELLELRVGR